MPRIALIHALAQSVEPINTALARDWPDAVRMNLLDDSLSADLARSARGLDDAMQGRFDALADYAIRADADAILFTCSAFGPCIESVARRHPDTPILKPNEAMLADAVNHLRRHGGRIGLVATFAPTLASMPAEFPSGTPVLTALAVGGLDALRRGDVSGHDRAAAQAALELRARECTVIALAQFSLARAAQAVGRASGLPVLTTVDSAVAMLRRRVERTRSDA